MSLQCNSVALKQGPCMNTFPNIVVSQHYVSINIFKQHCLQQPLLNPNFMHSGHLFANAEVLDRHCACRSFFSLQMIKIMWMEMMNVAVMMRVGMPCWQCNSLE
jgi:hypothetical protein